MPILKSVFDFIFGGEEKGPSVGGGPLGVMTPFVVLVANLKGDAEGAVGRRVVAALSGRGGLSVFAVPQNLEPDGNGAPYEQMARAAEKGRSWLEASSANLLIWGKVTEDGKAVSLRFIACAVVGDNRAGAVGLGDRLELPVEIGNDASTLLYATVLVALSPETAAQRQTVQAFLPTLTPVLERYQTATIPGLSPRQWARTQLCIGHATASLGSLLNNAEWLTKSIALYRRALQGIDRAHGPEDWGIAQIHLANALTAMASGSTEMEMLNEAVQCCRFALEAFPRDQYALDWAGTQNRLGLLHHRRGVVSGETGPLSEAIVAFQAALQEFTKTKWPTRWAEVLNNMARSMQVQGEFTRSKQLLDQAVAICGVVMKVLSRDKQKILWAATQINLGTTLFALGKVTFDNSHLAAAETAFRDAIEIYKAGGDTRMVQGLEMHLFRLQRFADSRSKSGDAKGGESKSADGGKGASDGKGGDAKGATGGKAGEEKAADAAARAAKA